MSRIRFSTKDGIGRITLAAPAARNAVDIGWCEDFAEAAKACATDASLRVVLIEAEGDFFSVGGDIDHFIAHRNDLTPHVRRMAALFHEGLLSLHNGRLPVVSAVQGLAAGGGFSLALQADLILAAQSARFCSAYSSSGLSPDGGLTYTLPRMLGTRRAFEIMALNPVLDAETAQRLGIVARVFADDVFRAEVEACIARLAGMSAGALAALKKLLAASLDNNMEQQLAMEAESVAQLAGSEDTQAILEAFLARRR